MTSRKNLTHRNESRDETRTPAAEVGHPLRHDQENSRVRTLQGKSRGDGATILPDMISCRFCEATHPATVPGTDDLSAMPECSHWVSRCDPDNYCMEAGPVTDCANDPLPARTSLDLVAADRLEQFFGDDLPLVLSVLRANCANGQPPRALRVRRVASQPEEGDGFRDFSRRLVIQRLLRAGPRSAHRRPEVRGQDAADEVHASCT